MILTVAALALTTSCTNTPQAIGTPSRVLQSVNVSLAPNGAITTVNGTAVSVDDATGNSSSVDTVYETEKVANDLPVRVSTQYRTAEKTGSNLEELAGYNGRVEIELTVENLTVSSQELTFDVAGESRTAPTLVGAPMSIAASTVLPNVAPSRIVGESGDQAAGTNGIVSASPDGETIVQWATLLAPPSAAASTTLRLVADVTDFKTPQIDLAVQPGMATDLSVDGVLDSAFNTSPTSELALQRRTIDLIADVNDVLGRAGATITDVRTNLESTSKTLGVSTAAHLKESTESLAGTMSGLKDQLGSLKGDLDATVSGTESTTIAQLSQTVGTVDAMLGDTKAAPPRPVLNGNGCSTVVAPTDESSTVYSSLVLMSAQLDGFAQSTASCRDEVAESLKRTVGPNKPTAETCTEPSMTCAFYASSVSVVGALVSLVQQGDELVAALEPEILAGALARHEDVSAGIDDLAAALEELDKTASKKDVNQAIVALRTSTDEADAALEDLGSEIDETLDDLQDNFDSIHGLAAKNSKKIGDKDTRGSLAKQNAKLADDLCELVNDEKIELKDAEKVLRYMTDAPCVTDQETEPAKAALSLGEFPAPMDERLQEQGEAWDDVASLAGISIPKTPVNKAIKKAEASLATIDEKINDLAKAVKGGSDNVGAGITELKTLATAAQKNRDEMGAGLLALEKQQSELEKGIKDALRNTTAEAASDITDLIDSQIRVVADQATQGTSAVVDSFDRSVSGLTTTAADVAKGAKESVDAQHDALAKEGEALATAISEQTATSLKGIEQSTSASTRDVAGASTLLAADLTKVMLDLGDRTVNGSGLLGSMATSAAKADTADYQLALATQNAQGYANIRSEDVAGILQRQAQFKASMEAATTLPSFHLEVPSGAASQTLYAFRIGGQK
ncbi:hypothetical protein ACSYDW_17525 [Paeniglutamicibacter sp. R2-26]|uniref:hypothetical protein n=1 Tax=Paeniglutamicibacter sp. R2-26 TaxID=3144417 RepID=UPI003EE4B5B6